jgi:hypothetical protein
MSDLDITRALSGHSIVDIYLHESGERIAIIVGGSNHIISIVFLETEGDCCSHSWVEHIGNAEACHMARFEDWVNTDIEPTVDELSEGERGEYSTGELKFYFFKILTDKGECVIEMRNSSNGYYGGMLNYVRTDPFLDHDLEQEGFKLARGT